MKCRYCNSEIADDSVYCEFCGKKLVGKHINFLIVLGVLLGIGIVGGITAFVLYQNNNFVEEAISPMTVEKTLSPEERAELIAQGYVDLGLPSGTLWKESNEGDQGSGEIVYYGYDEAVQLFGNHLPTKEQWEELNNSCTWTWTGSGYDVIGPNGNSIFLPAGGNRGFSGRVYDMWEAGFYWSTTPKDSEGAWDLEFDSSGVDMDHADRRLGQSVRLVHSK